MCRTDQSPSSEGDDLTAVAYLRVASPFPADQSAAVDRQRAAITRAADRLGLTVTEEFIDLGYSGMSRDRPGLLRLLDRAATGRVGYCIVAQADRFSRDAEHYADIDQALSDAGVAIVDASRRPGETIR
ncbi:recombinase family protein [Calidifontibacter sp. DB0510]|uniref:Recombinase family protein n=1 Tax=Metallococcus carri TaxID=1656884 RepID=A0A967EAG6_9MICO|nr:recombinase family protein [Metallococcus carri]NHN55864.1 recombinase family protein [Metallococcus carri]NOP38448.1 recombinase family protein [Calidifontibacter sp. DB2511S]